jgi:DNA-3-methyladenine glycosylase II
MKYIVNEEDIKKIIRSDKVFSDIYVQYGPPPNWNRPEGFVTLSKIILEQQVSLESAKAHFIKLNSYLPVFSPQEILKLTDIEMRNCQVSRQKANYLRALSEAVISESINLESLSKHSLIDIRQQLKTIKGIGDWTCDIYLIFCLQSKDIFPSGDIALLNTIKELKGIQSKAETEILIKSWSPLCSLAAYFLWHHYLSKRNRIVNY